MMIPKVLTRGLWFFNHSPIIMEVKNGCISDSSYTFQNYAMGNKPAKETIMTSISLLNWMMIATVNLF